MRLLMKNLLQSFLPIVLVLASLFIVIIGIEFEATMAANKAETIHIQKQEALEVNEDDLTAEDDTDFVDNKQFIQAKALVKKGLFNEAEKLYHSLLLQSPNAQLYNGLGILYFKQKNYAKAIHSYENALRYDKSYYRSYYNRAILYKTNNELSRAKVDYQQAIFFHPYHFKSYMNLGSVLTKLDEDKKAIKIYTKALGLSSGKNRAKIFYRLAKINKNIDIKKSKLYLEKAVRLYPTFMLARLALIEFEVDPLLKVKQLEKLILLHPTVWEAVETLANVYKAEKNYTKALMLYQNYLSNQPESIKALYESSEMHYKLRHYKESISVLKALLAINGNHDKANIRLIQAYMKNKNFNQALVLATKRLKEHPKNIKMLQIQAEVFRIQKRLKLYEKSLKHIAMLYPQNSLNLKSLALFYADKKAFVQAHTFIDKALQAKTTLASLWYLKGSFYDQEEQALDAIRMYQKSLDLNPSYSKALFNIAKDYVGLKEYQKALGHLSTLEKLRPNRLDVKILSSKIYYSLKNYEKSEAQIEKALEIYPQSFKALRHKAKVFSKTRRNEKAAEIFSSLLDRKPTLIVLRYSYAKSLKKSKQYEKAYLETKHILQLRPNYTRAQRLQETIKNILQGNKK